MMDEARSRDRWGRHSILLATVINSNPFRSGKPVSADELNPYAGARATAKRDEPVRMPFGVFIQIMKSTPAARGNPKSKIQNPNQIPMTE